MGRIPDALSASRNGRGAARDVGLIDCLGSLLGPEPWLATHNRRRLRALLCWYFDRFQQTVGEYQAAGEKDSVMALLDSMFETGLQSPSFTTAMARVLADGVAGDAGWCVSLSLYVAALTDKRREKLPPWFLRRLLPPDETLERISTPGLAAWVLEQGWRLWPGQARISALLERFGNEEKVLVAAWKLVREVPASGLEELVQHRVLTLLEQEPERIGPLAEAGVLSGLPTLPADAAPSRQGFLRLLGQDTLDPERMEILIHWLLDGAPAIEARAVAAALDHLAGKCHFDFRVMALVGMWCYLEQPGSCTGPLFESVLPDEELPEVTDLALLLWHRYAGHDEVWRWYWATGLLACLLSEQAGLRGEATGA